MQTIQSLIESELTVQQIVEVFGGSGITYVKEPCYNGTASVKLKIDTINDGGWKGVVEIDDRETQISDRYGVQKQVQGLIVPAGVSVGEWKFKGMAESAVADVDSKTLYLVGQYYPDVDEHGYQGIFDTEEKAIEACKTECYWYTAFTLNKSEPHERQMGSVGVDFYYPKMDSEDHDFTS